MRQWDSREKESYLSIKREREIGERLRDRERVKRKIYKYKERER